MADDTRTIEVYVDTAFLKARAGVLTAYRSDIYPDITHIQFAYDREWLANPKAFELSPDMPLAGRSYGSGPDRDMLGAFADSMPDRWGMRLIEKQAGRAPLGKVDYLLGMPDYTRQGALRFSDDGGRTFIGREAGVNRLSELKEQHEIITRIENGTASESDVNRIIASGGSSNGGQYPKSALIDDEGDLCIVKYQGEIQRASPQWEAVCLELARRAGIEVPDFSLHRLGDDWALVEKRFDRTKDGNRIPYMSADTFLLLPVRPLYVTNYTSFAGELRSRCGSAEASKLFDRIAFFLLVNNVDDHYKNHGLLYDGKGWKLSPMFDVNPTTLGDPDDLPQLSAHSEYKRSLANLVETAEYYGIKRDDARTRIHQISEAVSQWRMVADSYGIPEDESGRRAGAFGSA